MSSDLSAAVRSVEAFLLYPHSRYTAPPTPPTELPGCPLYEGARKAANAVVEAKWEQAFQEPVIAELLQKWEDVETLERSLREAAAGKGPEGELSVLVAAVACLQCFVQANWTGPEVTGEAIPMFPNQRALESARNSYIMSRLEVDGEPLYDVTRGPQLLLTSVTVLCGDMLRQSSLESVGVWRARAAFVWQRMLAEATARGDGQSVTCMQACVQEYGEALRKGGYITEDLCRQVAACGPSTVPSALREGEDDRDGEEEVTVKMMPCEAVPNTVRSVLVLELAIHTSYYGLPTDVSDDIIDVAAKHVGFSWEITGVEGIKRRYQTQAFAQLTCVTKSSLPAPMVGAAAAGETTGEDEGAHQNVQMAELDPDTDVLESVQYTSDEFKPTVLHAVEQAILLTKAVRLLLSSAADDDDAITMEQIGCLVNRALVLPENFNDPRDAGCSAHWLVYSAGLWLRCRTEFGRVKTRNRAAFQLQALVDQYKDKLPEDEGGA
ncbi:Tetratricopeptide repeat domain 27, partial [Perkinsus olseni]